MVNQDNREIAVEFLSMAANGSVRKAFRNYVSDSFVHHNAYFPSDRESLLIAMEQSAAAEPNKAFTIKQIIESGNRVVVLSHLERAATDTEYAVVHILQIERGSIVEMWDIGQEIPKDSPNLLGMF